MKLAASTVKLMNPNPKSQAQILSELEATLKALLIAFKETIQVKENAEISQERIQELIEKIEEIEHNPTEISELTTTVKQLVIYIQKLPRTDLTQISNKLDQLSKQTAAIPILPPSKPDLSNLVTRHEIESLTQSIRQKENILLALVAFGTLLIGGVTIWSVASIKNTLTEQIQQVPESIQQHQLQQKEIDKAEAKLQQKKRRK